MFITDTSSLNEPVLQDQVEKLNRQNAQHSLANGEADGQKGETRGGGRQEQVELILDEAPTPNDQAEEKKEKNAPAREEEQEGEPLGDSEPEVEEEKAEEKLEEVPPEQAGEVEDDGKKRHDGGAEETPKPHVPAVVPAQERYSVPAPLLSIIVQATSNAASSTLI